MQLHMQLYSRAYRSNLTFIRRFYPKQLTVHSGYKCFSSTFVPWELNPLPFAATNAMLYHWATGTSSFLGTIWCESACLNCSCRGARSKWFTYLNLCARVKNSNSLLNIIIWPHLFYYFISTFSIGASKQAKALHINQHVSRWFDPRQVDMETQWLI